MEIFERVTKSEKQVLITKTSAAGFRKSEYNIYVNGRLAASYATKAEALKVARGIK